MGYSSVDITERFQWTFPIVFSPTDPKTLYATSQHVWKRPTRARAGRRISPDLTRHDPETLRASGGPITLDQTGVETYAVVFTLAPSPLDGNVDLGRLRRRLRARHPRRRQELGRTSRRRICREFTRISLIEASPHRRRHGVPGRQPLPARRPRAVRLQDGRLRQDLDEDRHRHPGRRLRARHPRGPEAQGAAVPRAPRPASTSRSTTARSWQSLQLEPAGHAGARHRRSRTTTWSSARTAARSTCMRQHRRAAAGLAGDDQRARRALRSRRRDAIGRRAASPSTTS